MSSKKLAEHHANILRVISKIAKIVKLSFFGMVGHDSRVAAIVKLLFEAGDAAIKRSDTYRGMVVPVVFAEWLPYFSALARERPEFGFFTHWTSSNTDVDNETGPAEMQACGVENPQGGKVYRDYIAFGFTPVTACVLFMKGAWPAKVTKVFMYVPTTDDIETCVWRKV